MILPWVGGEGCGLGCRDSCVGDTLWKYLEALKLSVEEASSYRKEHAGTCTESGGIEVPA